METPRPSDADWCRSILAELLRPIDARAAGYWSDRLIARYGSIGTILAVDEAALATSLGDERPARYLKLVRATMLHVLRAVVEDRPLFRNVAALKGYLFAAMAHDTSECVRVLFLDAGNRLIRDELVSRGSVSGVPLDVRQIVARCLELHATALIVVHNHPSGDPAPGAADIAATQQLKQGASALGIVLHDHVVVARTGLVSMRQQGLF